MHIVNFPPQKREPGQFEQPRAVVTGLAHSASKDVMQGPLQIMKAETAEQSAAAIATLHETLERHSAGFAALVKQTSSWR